MKKGEKITQKRFILIAIAFSILIFSVTAASAAVSHSASQITAGTFGSGDFVFPNNLDVNENLFANSVLVNSWLYNQTTPANSYTNAVVSANTAAWSSTYNATYHSYAAYSYNQTAPANAYTDVKTGTDNLHKHDAANITNVPSAWTTTYNATYDSKNSSQWIVSGNNIYSRNSGNVGIGTMNPGEILEIKKATVSADQDLLRLTEGSVPNYERTIAWHDTANIIGRVGMVYTGSPDETVDFVVRDLYNNGYQSTTELFRVRANGNVGIGTGSPRARLEINGSTHLLRFYDSGLTADKRMFQFSTSTSPVDRITLTARNDAGTFLRDIMTWTHDGNVGIGTAGPYNPLQVAGTIKSATTDQTGMFSLGANAQSTSQVGVYRGNAAVVTAGNFLNLGGYGGITFSASAANLGSQTEWMRITTGGNVGIGTTNPGNKLDVAGDQGAIFSRQSAGGGYTFVGYNDAGHYGRIGAYDGIWRNFVIAEGGGNVGIGTTSPGAKLDVRGNVSLNDNILFARGGGDTNHKIVWENAGYNSNRLRIHEYGEILFSTNSGDRMVIQDSGNVGIGTTSPFTTLDVYKSGANYPISWTNGVSRGILYTDNTIVIVGSYSNHPLSFITNNGPPQMILTTAGKVGIGTTSPASQLEVKGTSNDRLLTLTDTNQNNAARYFGVFVSGSAGTPDNEFTLRNDGQAYADGAWNGGGADYAEWFEKEGDFKTKDVVGLNAETGKVRKYQNGDILVGIYSENPGFVGNRDIDKTDEEMIEGHALVSLMGQVNINPEQINVIGNKIYTKDSQMLGYLLSNGKILLKIK